MLPGPLRPALHTLNPMPAPDPAASRAASAPRPGRAPANRLSFPGLVGVEAAGRCLARLRGCLERGSTDLELDFSACRGADPRVMPPLLAALDVVRRAGIEVSASLPGDRACRRRFLESDWAHLLDPKRYDPATAPAREGPNARRFTDFREQQRAVDASVEMALGHLPLRRDFLAALEWVAGEVTDNVLTHAECAEGGIVQTTVRAESGQVEIAVADAGRGLLASLRESRPQLETDAEAAALAVERGVTRDPDAGQGQGLAGTLRIASLTGGAFEIASGTARLTTARLTTTPDLVEPVVRRNEPPVPGVCARVELGPDPRFRLSEALGFAGADHRPVDLVETRYETGDGSAILVRLSEASAESGGFGSREAGRRWRTKCRNLLRAAPGKPLVLDWGGVRAVSSGFADEFLGKLHRELAPLGLRESVRNTGMEPAVRGVLERPSGTAERRFLRGGSRPRAPVTPPESTRSPHLPVGADLRPARALAGR